ncbi:unnamed protein product [Didymodactylos carnosus]|uniref:S-adenosyl-L-methionine-dependent methyltransferase n=1 Tax=Didymodactylos carnosus TaxID=1234261 RepID=A0A814EKX4_9BILA|nr:unnamed protein product [Didymodactylos carnosus]CAF1514333.1 unnamed protein product [Didymodactylos carnosus]CAF3743929.1 unnamed protein product [Didymodactylos carnosus]CAF4301852.1 unnamed protein product [Didymodactylos carnosus]
MTDKSISSFVSKTSQITAAARAYETMKDNYLFQDPFAKLYSTEKGFEYIKSVADNLHTPLETSVNMIAIRTKYFDDQLLHAIQTCGIRQIVILACGGDFRPYRLIFPDTNDIIKFYVLDFEEVIDFREECFKKLSCPPTNSSVFIKEIACDLSKPLWPSILVNNGFKPNECSFWILEGLLSYLDETNIYELFSHIKSLCCSSNPSRLICDLIIKQLYNDIAQTAGWGTAIKFGIDEPEQFFEGLGCTNIQCTKNLSVGKSYYRVPEEIPTSYSNTNFINATISS